ncbi:hypothetical protein SVAN01_06489 [Stagonosporopsis vannaccii]|nr:hypothetical protein SVAN01_06489 [Stagonosporopsis vannaccii]
MAARVGLSRTGAAKLLKTVEGKQHASKEDHEEILQQDINAGPDLPQAENLRLPTKQQKPMQSVESANEDALIKPPNRKRKAEPLPSSRETKLGLKVPGMAKNTRTAALRVPRVGQFQQGRAAKEGLEAGKENLTALYVPPASSQGNEWGFNPLLLDSSQGSQKARKNVYGSKARGSQVNSNIHTTTKKQSKVPIKHGSKTKKLDLSTEDDEEDLDNISLLSDTLDGEQVGHLETLTDMPKVAVQDPELRRVPQKKKNTAQTNGDASGTAGLGDLELEQLLKPTLREQLGLTDNSFTSLPASSAPQEDMENIDSYVRKLPAEADEDTACPICHEPVDQEYYWNFWIGLDRTVKNQATFCHMHRKASAQAEYAAEGYPVIDWDRLPERIKNHRMALYNILVGETPSAHRLRYEPLALTGKAATVPSKRNDLSPSKQRNLASLALDDNAVYPGYYGPRGRRTITECVMALLHTEIKRSVDPVVQTSGPATFVQAVLVPEVAVRLIMEDAECDCDEAEEIRESTFEMGLLLNEEIEDEVIVGEEDEGENEYH